MRMATTATSCRLHRTCCTPNAAIPFRRNTECPKAESVLQNRHEIRKQWLLYSAVGNLNNQHSPTLCVQSQRSLSKHTRLCRHCPALFSTLMVREIIYNVPMTTIYHCDSDPVLITSELLKRMAWGTHLQGPQRRILSCNLYLQGQRKCKGELLECGHIVVPGDGSRRQHRRCPLCHELRTRGAL